MGWFRKERSALRQSVSDLAESLKEVGIRALEITSHGGTATYNDIANNTIRIISKLDQNTDSTNSNVRRSRCPKSDLIFNSGIFTTGQQCHPNCTSMIQSNLFLAFQIDKVNKKI
jgi:hypothetical protein